MPRAVLCSCIGNLLLPLSTFAIQNVSTVQDFEAAFRRANASKDFRTARVLGPRKPQVIPRNARSAPKGIWSSD
jgi:hypothetical protein